MAGKKLKGAIEESRSNILPYIEGTPSAKMLFELICNPCFIANSFFIDVTKVKKLSYPTSTMPL